MCNYSKDQETCITKLSVVICVVASLWRTELFNDVPVCLKMRCCLFSVASLQKLKTKCVSATEKSLAGMLCQMLQTLLLLLLLLLLLVVVVVVLVVVVAASSSPSSPSCY